jgi:hypothetical protein
VPIGQVFHFPVAHNLIFRSQQDFCFSFRAGQGYNSNYSFWNRIMMMYVLICLSLTLAAIAGLQLLYVSFLKRMDGVHKKEIVELERKNKYLQFRLEEADREIASQHKLLEVAYDENEEVWADVIDDR